MASSAISAPAPSLYSSSTHSPSFPISGIKRRLNLCTRSSCSIAGSRVLLCNWVPHLALVTPFSSWACGISTLRVPRKTERKTKWKRGIVFASLFGVGAPEALVIGVVALLVFGPKGLAEVARNLGKTLREFQPTIKELQEVSQEFKSTLEKEIGLDDIRDSNQSPFRTDRTASRSGVYKDSQTKTEPPNGSPQSPTVESIDNKLKDIEEGEPADMTSSVENQLESQVKTEDGSQSSPTEHPQVEKI
ncbi:unnamed protein product [Cuscuta campestris]|uniref:Sec-independent protein translocase protein TATB, chloroplastic n=1 Tax=Cuscuta campestris TaxID=132261 RepID=A0A484KE51_9ASTE|nr:unnamed protein product [Cuscuta campestris]